MNDRYLFRAKRKYNGEWVEGCLVIDESRENEYKYRIKPIDNSQIHAYPVDPSTICQCTGLEDKNGVLIWENDICGRKEKNAEIVTYNNGDWTLDYSYAFKRKRGTDYCNLGFYANVRKCVEVIGNIFDNPELMEQEG